MSCGTIWTHWQARRFDYIGAPWPMGREPDLSMSRKPGVRWYTVTAYVGNGGFSLRRIAACRQLLSEFAEEAAWFGKHGAEDNFFACFGQFSQQFILPSLRVAAAFAWETSLPRMHALCEGQLPMAIHAYDKHDPEFFARTIQSRRPQAAETQRAHVVLCLPPCRRPDLCYKMPMNLELREKGFLPAKGLLEPTLARVVHKTLLLQQWRRECFRDNHIPTAASVTNTPLTDTLLLELRPRIEAISACRLVPTYSYARVYFHGDAMVRHHDRGSCEVSVSIHLARDGGDAKLWFHPGTGSRDAAG